MSMIYKCIVRVRELYSVVTFYSVAKNYNLLIHNLSREHPECVGYINVLAVKELTALWFIWPGISSATWLLGSSISSLSHLGPQTRVNYQASLSGCLHSCFKLGLREILVWPLRTSCDLYDLSDSRGWLATLQRQTQILLIIPLWYWKRTSVPAKTGRCPMMF